jgi:hypothetical protein
VRIARTDRPAYGERPTEQPPADIVVVAEDDVAPDVNVMDETALHPFPWAEPAVDPDPLSAPSAATSTSDPADTGSQPAVSDPAPPTPAGNWDPAALGGGQPGMPGQPQAPSVPASAVARLLFSSGEVVDVDRVVVVGRAPEAGRSASSDEPLLVTVPSPHQEISSAHLEIRPGAGADHGSAVVTDLGSTNGTVLQQPGLPPEDLRPGIAVQLVPGAVIDLGDGVTIQVGHA